MPTDSSGKFHLNSQRAMAADKAMKAPKTPEAKDMKMAAKGDQGNSGSHMTIHDHGDGSYHTESHEGEKTDHASIHEALSHAGAKMVGGKHMHVHHDGMSMHSGHSDDSGQTEGHDHENLDALKSSMDQFLDEEGKEGDDKSSDDSSNSDHQDANYRSLSGL